MILNADRALVGAELRSLEPGVVSVRAGRIESLGHPGTGDETLDLPGVTLLPGFIDSHVHIGFFAPRAVLAGGVTTVRDLAWPPEDIYPLARASRSVDFDGPEIHCVGPMLTVSGGYPTRAAWAPPGTGAVVGSPAEAGRTVESQAALGAVAIKVALNAEVGPTLELTTLRAICDTAHELGLDVTAHVFGISELAKALEGGVDELAHILMSPERIPDDLVAALVERDVTVVPTLSVFSGRALEIAIDNVARFVATGGRVVYGTDLGNAGPRPGIERLEIEGLVAAGLDARAVIAAATTRVGAPLAAEKGVLAEGFAADVVGVRGDCLARPTDLCDVAFVMRGGRVVVGP